MAAVIVIIVAGASVMVVRLDDQIATEARDRLAQFVRGQADDVDRLMEDARNDIRLASRNAVFHDEILTTSADVTGPARAQIEAAIEYIGDRYNVDEIGLIRSDGAEIARYDSGEIAAVEDLSSDESVNNPAFKPAMRLPEDSVHVTDPYVSPDSERWVFGLATPIFVADGTRAGVLHFELPVVGVTSLLHKGFAADSFGFMIQHDGALLFHPRMAEIRAAVGIADAPDAAFPAATAVGDESWNKALVLMMAAHRGSTTFDMDGRRYVVNYYDANKAADVIGVAVPERILFADIRRVRTDLAVTLGPLILLLLAVSGYFASRLRRAHNSLEASNRESGQLAAIVVAADDAIVRTDLQGHIVTWNNGAEHMYGYTAEEAVGRPLAELVSPTRRSEVDSLLASVARGEPIRHETVHANRNGRDIDVTITLSPIRSEDDVVSACSVVVRDITMRKQLEQELSHQALHDSLTGLPNRPLFLDRLAHALETARRREGDVQRQVAVLFLDMDEFKVINDSLGHRFGDELLKKVAERLSMAIRPGDTCSRLGGDEFTVLLENIEDVRNAERAAKRLIRRFDMPFELDGHRVVVTASVGIAVSGESNDPDEILRRADLAMYEAKARGKARYAVFDQSMEDRAWERLQLESELRLAIAEGQFHVHYQPIFELATGAVHSVEALVRWMHPKRGWVLPADFIPLAEQSGLILAIGSFVLRTAVEQMQTWGASKAGKALVVSVNVSPRQLREPEFVDNVAALLKETNIDASLLQLEITESLIQEDETSVMTVSKLRALGVHVALDDFGTGYSSLGSLRRLPIDSIKIDRSFVSGTSDPEQGNAIVTAAVGFAAAAGLQVTAEGIETVEQLAALLKLGCRYGQGFLLAEVLPADEITDLIQSPRSLEEVASSGAKRRASRSSSGKSKAKATPKWSPAGASG